MHTKREYYKLQRKLREHIKDELDRIHLEETLEELKKELNIKEVSECQ